MAADHALLATFNKLGLNLLPNLATASVQQASGSEIQLATFDAPDAHSPKRSQGAGVVALGLCLSMMSDLFAQPPPVEVDDMGILLPLPFVAPALSAARRYPRSSPTYGWPRR
jgi:hypothetical protein